jgi:hypothetical protein
MGINSDHVEILEIMDRELKSEITDLELEVKIEKLDEERNIKTVVFEETNNFEPLRIIREKRKNQEISNSEIESKKFKEEFEDLDHEQEPQKIKKNYLHDSNNQVTFIMGPTTQKCRIFYDFLQLNSIF